MLQQPAPDDYVLATGRTHSVRHFAERAFARAGVELAWEGFGAEEMGIDRRTGRELIAIDPRYFRPTEVDVLVGDAGKARDRLGWRHETGIEDLIAEMVDEDVARFSESRCMLEMD